MKNTPKPGLGNRIAPPRFLLFLVVMIAGSMTAMHVTDAPRAILIGFGAGAVLFLLSCISLLGHGAEDMRRMSQRNDANRAMLLVIAGIVCSVVLVAIGVELSQRSMLDPLTTALIIGTLLIAWLFSNVTYALHYAHVFYSPQPDGDSDCGGVDFPDTAEPDYWDFIYFAFTLGMTFQTSDVGISSRSIRRTVLFHCFAAFVFNIGVLAFTINVLGS